MRALFASAGIDVPTEEIRASMGLHKKDHIRAIATAHGRANDAESLYTAFMPMQMERLVEHSGVIAGVVDAVERMRKRGLKIGSTTGYNRAMLDYVKERAKAQGYAPDCALCPDDVGGGRPMPWMCFAAAVFLRVYPPATMVKIGDTGADIAEGRNAGMWTIGVARTGNEVGLSQREWDGLGDGAKDGLLRAARDALYAAGADYVIDSVGEVDDTLDRIEERLARGEKP
jgi:phosphonoacetaldehyde hydrolase